METDSKSLYYKLRMEGKSDAEAQETCADFEADAFISYQEHLAAELEANEEGY